MDDESEAKDIVTQVKRIVTFFHKSTKKLRLIQERLNLPEFKLIQQVETRWNSTFYMLERYLLLNEAVSTTLCVEKKQDLVISADSNPLIQEITTVLRPFVDVTRQLSAEKFVSASKIIPLAAENNSIIHRTGH